MEKLRETKQALSMAGVGRDRRTVAGKHRLWSDRSRWRGQVSNSSLVRGGGEKERERERTCVRVFSANKLAQDHVRWDPSSN
jgi:hypothetical protein